MMGMRAAEPDFHAVTHLSKARLFSCVQATNATSFVGSNCPESFGTTTPPAS